jgi:hypothetical protein
MRYKERFKVLQISNLSERFEVFMAVKIQVRVFWVVTSCSVLTMEAALASEPLVFHHNITWSHNPEDLSLNLYEISFPYK